MYGIYFGDYYTNDHDLILTDVDISFPTPKRTTIEIEGRDGVLDLTQALTSEIKYEMRDVSFEFEFKGSIDTYDEMRAEIAAAIHGQYLKVIQDSEPDYYWDAFVEVDDFALDKRLGKLSVSCEAYPYKYKLSETTVELTLTEETSITLSNEQMPAIPTIVTDGEINIVCGDNSYTLSEGEWIATDLTLAAGETEWTITPTDSATVTITYQEGRL